MVARRLFAGEADDDQGAAGRQMLTDVGEGDTERQLVNGGDTRDDVVRAERQVVQRIANSEASPGLLEG